MELPQLLVLVAQWGMGGEMKIYRRVFPIYGYGAHVLQRKIFHKRDPAFRA